MVDRKVPVSVIVPIYNVEEYLDRCISSIVKQSCSDIEIILVDDGSTDASPKICDDWAKRDERIIVIHQTNTGLSAARNSGIDISHGEYITFIDSDDFIHTQYIELLLSAAVENGCEISQCGYLLCRDTIDDKAISLKDRIPEVFDNQSVFFKRKAISAAWSRLFKRELIIRELPCFPEGKLYEDEGFAYKRLYWAQKIAVFPAVLYYHFIASESIMRNKSHYQSTDFFELFDERKAFFANNKALFDISVVAYCKSLMLLYYRCANDKDNENDIEEIKQLFKTNARLLSGSSSVTFIEKTMFMLFNVVPRLTYFVYRIRRCV